MSYMHKVRPRSAPDRRQKFNRHRTVAAAMLALLSTTAGAATFGFFLRMEAAHGGQGGFMAFGYAIGVVVLTCLSVFFGIHVLPAESTRSRKRLMPYYMAAGAGVAIIAAACAVMFAGIPSARDARDLKLVAGQFTDLATTKTAATPLFEAEEAIRTHRAELAVKLDNELSVGATCQSGSKRGPCTALIEGSLAKADTALRALSEARETYDLLFARATANIEDIVDARKAQGVSPAQRSANLAPLFDNARVFNEELRAGLPAAAVHAFTDDLEKPFLALGMTAEGARNMQAVNAPVLRDLNARLRESETQASVPLTDTRELGDIDLLFAEFGSVWPYAVLLFAFELFPLGLALFFGAIADDIEAEEEAARFEGVVVGDLLSERSPRLTGAPTQDIRPRTPEQAPAE